VSILVGESAIFNCDVDGIPTPSIDWYRQDAQMPKDRAERIVGGLKIRDARPEDEGLYFCQSSNELGSVRASASLSVHCKFPPFEFLIKSFERRMVPGDTSARTNQIVVLSSKNPD